MFSQNLFSWLLGFCTDPMARLSEYICRPVVVRFFGFGLGSSGEKTISDLP